MKKEMQARQRRSRGRAWYWKQTDSWYFTPPGTKDRVRLHDESGRPIRGVQSGRTAELALARVKADGEWKPTPDRSHAKATCIAKICSDYLSQCERRLSQGMISQGYHEEAVRYLNDLCNYCGRLTIAELQKGHIQHWLECHPTWKSTATRRYALSIVIAALNHGAEEFSFRNPLLGLELPPYRPRLNSFTAEDEKLLYSATDQCFANFLFAGIHTGLRPFCELARLTVGDILETERGMQWRVKSTKTDKTRVIPVRSEVAELTRQRVEAIGPDPTAILFRHSRDGIWQRGAGGRRFREIRQQLNWHDDPIRKQYTCYSCRHTFAHRMLAGYWNDGVGCSIEILSELMGDTPKVTFDHYGREWGQHYQEPLWAALGL